MRISILLVFIFSTLFSCAQSKSKKKKDLSKFQTAYFASGCFWCVEAVFESVIGVEEVVSGYSGGKEKKPTYGQVSRGETGHAESVKVYYDSSKVKYLDLLRVFFCSHDPSTYHQQGPDKGSQYRSIIFYKNESEKTKAKSYVNYLLENKKFNKITTELVPFEIFYQAEQYHQDYKKLNPTHPYVISVSNPRFELFKKKCPDLLKNRG